MGEGAEGKDAAKVTKQEATHKTISETVSCKYKEPGTKASKGAKGKKDEKQEAAKEGTTPSENGENKAEEAQKTESVAAKKQSQHKPERFIQYPQASKHQRNDLGANRAPYNVAAFQEPSVGYRSASELPPVQP
ncbi:hypothetical protein IHE44_0009586 [Lamprotornis superbus]|uniref:Uncharacterized protein n=1 Tax=Lamprotornis superbus TaxID=245042 RepID=A0A835NMU6_9PASS|nr:hypothetical protein IHE44_0009586 [Lamprotornis superbus]